VGRLFWVALVDSRNGSQLIKIDPNPAARINPQIIRHQTFWDNGDWP
jgi:hypothetical protein